MKFIETAYLQLLRRPADALGIQHYLEKLKQGYGQMFVLAALRTSPEGRKAHARVAGFGLSSWFYFASVAGQRIGLAAPTRLASKAYSAWRHLLLAASGRLSTRISQIVVHIQPLEVQHNTLRTHIEQQGTWNAHTQQRLDQQGAWNAYTEQRLDQQETWNAHTTQGFDQRFDQQETWNAHTAQRFDQRLDQQETWKTAVEQRLDRLVSLQTEQEARCIEQQQVHKNFAENNRFELQLLQARVMNLQLRSAVHTLKNTTPAAPSPPTAQPEIDTAIDDYYLAFENAMRGSHAEITQKLTPYLSHLVTVAPEVLALPMLDLGCGRGEWLELLCAQGFDAMGLDLNPAMVQHCQSRGLRAVHANALQWLAQQADASYGLVSGFHIIEHLPFDQLFTLIAQAWRVLTPGGVLVLETPNPENVLVGSHTFYHDHTHRNPITPTSLRFLLGYHGFSAQHFLRLNPYPGSDRVQETGALAERVNGHLYGPQDYGVVARKP
ncbi:MAG: class I SAM-dependent methyltransferase [Rhodoferax sp.]|nr:class I SAM-dependent methyltransferase [Rhodoferax sp.]